MSPLATERNEAEFIENQQIVLTHGSHEARELQLLLGTDQIIDQGSHIVKAHRLALSAGGESQSDGDVCFAQSRVADHENRLSLADVATLSQFQDACFADPLYAAPIELS